MPLHVPQLARKLGCLYQHHESVNTHEQLAECLGIAANNISTWVNGNEVRSRGFVPDKHVKRITDLFRIPVQLLETDSLERFKASVDSTKSNEGPWQRLLNQATTTSMIRLMLKASPPEITLAQRGLVADDKERREIFQLGDLLYIHFVLDPIWADRAENEKVYVLLLSRDKTRTSCLCPSAIAPEPEISRPNFFIPDKAPKRCLRVEGPKGPQSILALLTRIPLPRDLYSAMESGGTEALDHVARDVTHNTAFGWQLLRKDYEVV